MQPEVFYKNYVYDMCTVTMTSGDNNDYPYYRYCGAESWAIYNVLSDRRLKYVNSEFGFGLDKIKQLQVYNYTFKEDKKKLPHVGVMAQDLQKIFPEAVMKDAKGYLSIRMEDMFFAMVNAIKELDAKISMIASDYKAQFNILKQIQNDNKFLKQENKELKADFEASTK